MSFKVHFSALSLLVLLSPLMALAEPPSPSCTELDVPSFSTSILDWVRFHLTAHDPLPERTQTCMAQILEPELSGSNEEQFIMTLASDDKLNRSVHGDIALRKFLFLDPDLKPALATNELTQYRKVISHGPSARFLFAEPSGVREGYSIGQHSIRVLSVFDAQKDLYKLKEISVSGIRDIEVLLRYTLAFHDIGKSIAVRSGDKLREEKFSVPIAARLMRSLGFNEREVLLGSILIREHQTLGGYLQSRWSKSYAEESVRHSADELGILPEQMFRLFEIVFVCDAGSYPYLKQKVFTQNESGKLLPTGAKYQEFASVFASPHPL
jgi:hypothetical protein